MRFKLKKLYVILPVLIIIFGYHFLHPDGATAQITKLLRERDHNFSELLYTQLTGKEMISFYRTESNELGLGLFEDKDRGIVLVCTGGYGSVYSEDAITWHGKECSNFSVLYGTVRDPQISQIIVVSEEYKAAIIVESNDIRI